VGLLSFSAHKFSLALKPLFLEESIVVQKIQDHGRTEVSVLAWLLVEARRGWFNALTAFFVVNRVQEPNAAVVLYKRLFVDRRNVLIMLLSAVGSLREGRVASFPLCLRVGIEGLNFFSCIELFISLEVPLLKPSRLLFSVTVLDIQLVGTET
jgi:hypothetical protein